MVYRTPNDEHHNESMDIKYVVPFDFEQSTYPHSHHLLSLSLESKLHLAPLKKDDIQVRTTPLRIKSRILKEI